MDSHVTYCLLIGSPAVFVSLRSILLVELLGIDVLTKSFGILILFQGIATMVGAPLAGNRPSPRLPPPRTSACLSGVRHQLLSVRLLAVCHVSTFHSLV